MNAEPCSSAGEMTGTSWPMKAANGCTSRGGWARRRSPPTLVQRSTLSTSPDSSMRYPSSPCSAGVSPVAIELSAVAVVVGATVVIAWPSSADSVGSSDPCSSICSQPRPSSTSSTTWSAAATGAGIHGGSVVSQRPGPSSAGMIPRTQGPA